MSGPKSERTQRTQPPVATGALPTIALRQGSGSGAPGPTAYPISDSLLSAQHPAGRGPANARQTEHNGAALSLHSTEPGEVACASAIAAGLGLKRLVRLLAKQSAQELARNGARPMQASIVPAPTPVKRQLRGRRRHSTADAQLISHSTEETSP